MARYIVNILFSDGDEVLAKTTASEEFTAFERVTSSVHFISFQAGRLIKKLMAN